MSASNQGGFGGLLPTEGSYKSLIGSGISNIGTKFVWAKFSNMTTVGKNMNLIKCLVVALSFPLPSFSLCTPALRNLLVMEGKSAPLNPSLSTYVVLNEGTPRLMLS